MSLTKKDVLDTPGLRVKQASVFMSDETRTVLQNYDLIQSDPTLLSFRREFDDGRIKLESFGTANIIRVSIEL